MTDFDPRYKFIAPGSFEIGDSPDGLVSWERDGVVYTDRPGNADAIERMAKQIAGMNRVIEMLFNPDDLVERARLRFGDEAAASVAGCIEALGRNPGDPIWIKQMYEQALLWIDEATNGLDS